MSYKFKNLAAVLFIEARTVPANNDNDVRS